LEADGVRQIELIGGAPVFRLRGRLLPIVFLREALGITTADDLSPEDVSRAVNIVVLQADGQQFGLVVDRINDTEEIVVKPLGRHLKHISAFAGTTIMGDGAVALILDVMGIGQQANVVSEARGQAVVSAPDESAQERRSNVQTLLVCAVGSQRIAVPLAMVARLEEFPRASVEFASGREVVQYRGQLLPLLHLAHHLDGAGTSRTTETDPLQVLVYAVDGRSIGLVVDEILDIVEEEVTVRSDSVRPTVEYSGVIGRRVTDLIDVTALLRSADPSLFTHSGM
jgi:two-component system chemotaxis sensor kinase CheA